MSTDSQNKDPQDAETIRKTLKIDKSKVFKFIQGSVTRSTLVMEKINEERNKRMNAKPKEKPIYMVKETISSQFGTSNERDSHEQEDGIQKLRKEYFKLVFLLNLSSLDSFD